MIPDRWTDGMRRRVHAGRNFDCRPADLVKQLVAKAQERGVELWYGYRKSDKSITFQFKTDLTEWVPNEPYVRYVKPNPG